MELAALVLLDDNPDAVKLVATWPVVGVVMDGTGETTTIEDIAANLAEHQAVMDRWSQISGVDEEDIARLIPMLFANDILRPGGLVDDQALAYIKAPVAARLRRKVS